MTKPEKVPCTDPKEIHAQNLNLGLTKHSACDACGTPAEVGFFTGYTDTAVIAGICANHNCMSYGPGSLALAHKPDEHVPHADVERVERVLTALLDRELW